MDRTGIIVVTICVILLFLTWPEMPQRPQQPQPVTTSTNAIGTNVVQQPVQPAAAPLPSTPGIKPSVELESEKLVTLETEDSVYTFTSAGGLKTVGLNHHEAKPCSSTNQADVIHLNHGVDLPVFSLNGLEDSEFSIDRDGGLVTMVSTNQAGIRITKQFVAGTNYLLHTSIKLENTGSESVKLNPSKLVLGTAMPLRPDDTYPVWGTQWHNGEDLEEIDEGWFANRTLGCFPGTPRAQFVSPPQAPINWVGVHNRFFAMTTMPKTQLPGARIHSQKTTNHRLLNDIPTEGQYVHHTGILATLELPHSELEAGSAVTHEFTTYAGPKEYRTLVAHGVAENNSLQSVMGFDGFFGFFARVLLRSMNGLNGFGLSYAWSIIAITIIIKILFWPLTKASTVSMKRMSAYQPQMAEIREKYKSDPQKMNRKIMEFMREHKINPMGGCLPILIQLPVFFGFFTMLRSAVELRGAEFLWICDLSESDTVAHIFGFPINPMPMLMAVTMLVQARLTPTSPTMDPMQQKMMKYMPLIFIVILYNFSSGLTLYWTVQNMLSILQTKLTRNIVVDVPDANTANAALAKPIKAKPKNKRKK